MKNVILGICIGVGASTIFQAVAFTQSSPMAITNAYPAPPNMAFDILKEDVDLVLTNAPPAVDQQIRVVDVGKYNVAVGIIHREKTNDAAGTPVRGPYHDDSAEVYIIQSGGGVLTTGGTMTDKRPSPNYNLLNGPGGSGAVGPGAYSRRVKPGDIVIIPPGVLHAWSQITDQVTYLSVRPDPGRVLPAGYVNPLLLKHTPNVVGR
jgi:mannose-6-phosphate isomerase-like protein (cupin superfamily)